jgi:hypothetical protein
MIYKILSGLPFLLFFILGCKQTENQHLAPKTFSAFEISFTKHFDQHFFIRIDSNKIYFSPSSWNKTYYGILPDSIFKLTERSLLEIRSDTTIKSKDLDCNGCLAIAIQVVENEDTFRISQSEIVDKKLLFLEESLAGFIDTGKHQIVDWQISWTRGAVVPLPTSIRNETSKSPKVPNHSIR